MFELLQNYLLCHLFVLNFVLISDQMHSLFVGLTLKSFSSTKICIHVQKINFVTAVNYSVATKF